MNLSADQRAEVAAELKSIVTDLNLSDEQKEKLQNLLTQGREKLEEFRQQNPNVSKEELILSVAANRTAIRSRVVAFLTPEQLAKWDAAIAKAKTFMEQKAASA